MIATTTVLAPGFLWLLPLALLPWLGPLAARDRRHAALRSVALVCVVLALARPVRVATEERTHEVWILDRTASVTDAADRAQAAACAAALDARSPGAAFTVIEVGAERPPLALGAQGGDGRPVRRIQIAGFTGTATAAAGTPLGDALTAAARALVPGERGVVHLATDGLATDPLDGSAAALALADLAARGIPVNLRAPELAGEPGDLRVLGLAQTGTARVGFRVPLTARLVGGGQVVTCRLLTLDSEGGEVEHDRVTGVAVDGEVAVSFGYEPERPGFQRLALAVDVTDGVDPRPGDLRFERTLAVQDPLRALYLGERVAGGGAALAELVGQGIELREGASGDTLPTREELDDALADVDLVVLDDRPATRLPEALQRALSDAVADRGLGLFAAGGEAAFGPGGFHEQPLAELLPVEFVQKEEKRDPSTTLVVIIDTSGSMGGNRVQLAKEVARLAIRRLLPHDKVGMVEFYGAKRWAVPIQPASNSIEIERALNRLDAGGGTVILPAIEEAYYGLKNVRTRYKHVLILTDGGVETGAFEPLLRRMADEGMNVSTVLIGGDAHSEFLVTLANWGQGRFYSVPNRFNLPEILLKQPASAKLPAYRAGLTSVRVRGGAAWFGGHSGSSSAEGDFELPPVAGYVETRARAGAERVLETAADGHPLLASWRYGLGRVTAMTTEPTGPGSAPWRAAEADPNPAAPRYSEWLARALERTAADTEAPFVFELTREGDEALLIAERRCTTELVPVAELEPLDGAAGRTPLPLAFARVAPDRYEARWSLQAGAGAYVLCGVAPEAQPAGPWIGARVRHGIDPIADVRRELQVPPEAADALRAQLAANTVAAPSAATTVAVLREFAPLLALFALLAYVADVLYRRWPRSPSPYAR